MTSGGRHLYLSMRLSAALPLQGLTTLRHVLEGGDERLARLKNVGKESLHELRDAFEALTLKGPIFRDDPATSCRLRLERVLGAITELLPEEDLALVTRLLIDRERPVIVAEELGRSEGGLDDGVRRAAARLRPGFGGLLRELLSELMRTPVESRFLFLHSGTVATWAPGLSVGEVRFLALVAGISAWVWRGSFLTTVPPLEMPGTIGWLSNKFSTEGPILLEDLVEEFGRRGIHTDTGTVAVLLEAVAEVEDGLAIPLPNPATPPQRHKRHPPSARRSRTRRTCR